MCALVLADHPNMTRAQCDNVSELFGEVRRIFPIGKDVAKELLKSMWREEIGRQIGEMGIALATGSGSIASISDFINRIGDDFVPEEYPDPTTSDVEELLAALAARSQWGFNIPSLAKKVTGLSAGEFMVIPARPETGKTAAWVSLCAGPGGFCQQGAKVHAIVNEEPAVRTMMRAVNSASGMTRDEVSANPTEAARLFRPTRENLTVIDSVDMTMDRLSAYCKAFKPDIVVLDQIDKVGVGGSFARKDERLGETYRYAREIAKRHDLAVIGLTQASAEAQGKTQVGFSMMADSKTAKAAEADIVMGIGMPENPEADPTRYFHLSKNKVTGWHGTIPVILDHRLSRYGE